MFAALLLSAVLSGLDNLQVASAIGLLPLSRKRFAQYAVAFSLAETLAPSFGLLLGRWLMRFAVGRIEHLTPLVPLACGLGILILYLRNVDVSMLVARPIMVVGLPISLSVDNVLAGIGLGALHFPVLLSVMTIGVTDAMMSCAGLYAARRLRHIMPLPLEPLAAVLLFVFAVRMWGQS